jgi:serine/threonine-protein kinase
VGRPYDDAKKDLDDLGFEVDKETVDNPGDAEKDTVADVSPSGRVDPGETITLSVYDEPAPVETPTATATDQKDPKDQTSGDTKGKGKK